MGCILQYLVKTVRIFKSYQPVEILGRGNQVVGYGLHPDTGKPYEWVGDSEPLLTSFGDLPAVKPSQLRGLAEAIRALRVRGAPAGGIASGKPAFLQLPTFPHLLPTLPHHIGRYGDFR